ncbi:hypothetical protein SKAU_G00382930 [Synaphobranchus kaupii]|uniref:C-type lectin domain-containing protein n=1 Tax=Synaphobranchus kaupii TaxID=118154 RepID=A0A9Q1EE21_SYNKA|nr:hypothetical protein SKAU_G00382930 [Synaphobranchus kaupii]
MLGLVERLPDIHEGAGKWIRALEEETMGKLLAVGDLKALLARLLGMARMEEVLMKSGLQAAVNTPYLDGASFDQFRPAMWRTLREDYPTKIDPKSLKGEEVGDTVNPAIYLHRQLKRWKLETGRNPEGDELMTTRFRTSIVEAMPPPIYCVNLGGNLASVHSLEEYGFLRQLYKASDPHEIPFWIGLTDYQKVLWEKKAVSGKDEGSCIEGWTGFNGHCFKYTGLKLR